MAFFAALSCKLTFTIHNPPGSRPHSRFRNSVLLTSRRAVGRLLLEGCVHTGYHSTWLKAAVGQAQQAQ